MPKDGKKGTVERHEKLKDKDMWKKVARQKRKETDRKGEEAVEAGGKGQASRRQGADGPIFEGVLRSRRQFPIVPLAPDIQDPRRRTKAPASPQQRPTSPPNSVVRQSPALATRRDSSAYNSQIGNSRSRGESSLAIEEGGRKSQRGVIDAKVRSLAAARLSIPRCSPAE